MPEPDAVRDYLALALELDHLLPGAVAARSGDFPAWRPRGSRPAALVREAGRLALALPDAGLDPRRERFLAAQLAAVECTARRLAGQAVPLAVEIATCFGVPLRTGDEDAYLTAHRDLAALLPGPGTPADRLAAHRAADAVPRDRLPAALAACAALLRERSRAAGLLDGGPADEHVAFRAVDDAPWRALLRRTGPGRSEVLVNAGARPRRSQLLRLVAHEAYPGHHVEQLRREADLVDGRGWTEHRLVLQRSPQVLLTEGAAERGLEVLGLGAADAAGVLADVGLPFDAELAAAVDACVARLARVRVDAAVLLHAHRAPPADVHAHLRRWLLLDDAGAHRVLRAAADPRRRGQAVAYVDGAELVGAWLSGSAPQRVQRWRELIGGARTPDQLRRMVAVGR